MGLLFFNACLLAGAEPLPAPWAWGGYLGAPHLVFQCLFWGRGLQYIDLCCRTLFIAGWHVHDPWWNVFWDGVGEGGRLLCAAPAAGLRMFLAACQRRLCGFWGCSDLFLKLSLPHFYPFFNWAGAPFPKMGLEHPYPRGCCSLGVLGAQNISHSLL